MEHLKIRRKKWKKENLQSCFDDHCCDIAINVLEEQAYSKGFHDGYEEAKDNMVTAILTVFTIIGTVATLLGVLLGAFYSKCTDRNKHSIRCIGGRSNFYLSF